MSYRLLNPAAICAEDDTSARPLACRPDRGRVRNSQDSAWHAGRTGIRSPGHRGPPCPSRRAANQPLSPAAKWLAWRCRPHGRMDCAEEIVESVPHLKGDAALRLVRNLDLVERHVIFALQNFPEIGPLIRVFVQADVHRGTRRKPARRLRRARPLLNRDFVDTRELRCSTIGRRCCFAFVCAGQKIEASTEEGHG